METYLFKTLISFISLNAALIMFKPFYEKVITSKKTNFIKQTFNKLLPCLIPAFRWIWIMVVILIGFLLTSDEFVEQIKEKRNQQKGD